MAIYGKLLRVFDWSVVPKIDYTLRSLHMRRPNKTDCGPKKGRPEAKIGGCLHGRGAGVCIQICILTRWLGQ
jgi:hypothetical protein